MKLISYHGESGNRIAANRDGQLVDLHLADPGLPVTMRKLLELGPPGMERAANAALRAEPLTNQNVRLLPPVPDPQKIICVGLNYADHAAETGAVAGEEPVIFNKFPTALRADGEPIVLPKVASQVDYEAELVVVIGLGGHNIPRGEALSRVAGYTCGHDVSARDWQKGKPGRQWLLGKTFDSFAPCGPHLVTADQIDPTNLKIELRLNGQTRQSSRTDQLIFSVDFLISYLSKVATLLPGDLIFTGTPAGVGMARTPPVFLQPGDLVEIEIEKIGVLRNPVMADHALPAP